MHQSFPFPISDSAPKFSYGRQTVINADCRGWLANAERNSISAVITDPPYGLIEYAPEQQKKLRAGRGGIWRIPPAFDGANRRALPRFTVLSPEEREALFEFFHEWARAVIPVLRPGAHVFIASNPLVSPVVSYAIEKAGLERRGEIVRLVRTFRGGDRPKGSESEFQMVSTMPRSCWEPWCLFRKPLEEKTVSENLRKWGTGGLRRVSAQTPFLDVIQSGTTPDDERCLAPHPSVKPQHFLRLLVRAALPTGKGTILDPFSGSGTTLAACEHIGAKAVGVEIDPYFFELSKDAIPALARLKTERGSRQKSLPGL